jgi:type IV secretion system protein VirB6
MSCLAIATGNHFLGNTLAHLDCQGQTIGAYGYGALSDPGSIVAGSMTALLTIFIALFGIRLLLGQPTGLHDVVGGIIRVGLMLTLALSWPAWRIIGYDVVIKGPGEIAAIVGGASGLPGSNNASDNGLIARLQNADDGIVAMTQFGTGRLTGGVAGNSDRGDSFHGIALADDTGFGWGRVLFLTSALAPYGIVHVGGGILLALAPLMAGLMLFAQTMGLFVGWVRGLAFAALASVALTLVQGVELSILTPWANDILSTRDANTFTPSVPTELLALALAFCLINFGILALVGRLAFMPHATLMQWLTLAGKGQIAGASPQQASPALSSPLHPSPHESHSRAAVIAEAVASSIRREEAGGFPASLDRRTQITGSATGGSSGPSLSVSQTSSGETLGNSYRRAQRRTSTAGQKRDRTA